MRLVLACLALLSTDAAGPRVALYTGAGSAATSAGNFSASFAALVDAGVLSSLTELDGPGVGALLNVNAFDVVVFPGGGGSSEAKAIGAAGAAAVVEFVRSGGGYYGTCAGGYLAGTASCCDVAIPGYCGGASGCVTSAYGLAIIDMGVAEPWDRGHGYVEVAYSAEAVAMLRLPARYASQNTSVLYFQGPIQDRQYRGNWTSGATFLSEIHYLHPNQTTGQMVGTPALVTSTFGSGRVLISAPHPEETIPRLDDVVEAYVLWAAKAI